MSEGITAEITFTEILYSAVIANALAKLTFGITLRNGMLLLAVLVILSDWVEYSAFLTELDQNVSTVAVFVSDMLVLLVWHTLTIIPGSEFVWYIATMALFFTTQHIWELISGRLELLDLVQKPTTGLVLGYALIAMLVGLGQIESTLALGLGTVLFVVGKIPACLQVRQMDTPIQL